MNEKLTFSGKMNEDDFKKLFIYQTGFKLLFIIPIYFFIFGALLFILKTFTDFKLSILLITITSGISSILFVFVYIFLLYRRLKKDFIKDLPKIKEQTYIVQEDRISILVDNRTTDLLFADIKKIKDSKYFFVIHHKAKVIIAIPKRFIDNNLVKEIKEKFNLVNNKTAEYKK